MQEERLMLLNLIQNDLVAVNDGKRLLAILAEENAAANPLSFQGLRLRALQWLGAHRINAKRAEELLLELQAIAKAAAATTPELVDDLAKAMQLQEAQLVEAHTLIQILKAIQELLKQSPEDKQRAERREILELAASQKITGSTAIELLQALLPAPSPRPQNVASQPTSPQRPKERRGIWPLSRPAPLAFGRQDLRNQIQQEIQQALEETQVTRSASGHGLQRETSASRRRAAPGSQLSRQLDRLHDRLRGLQASMRGLEQQWQNLNQAQAPIAANLEDQLQHLRAALAAAHQQLAQVSEARADLEKQLPQGLADEQRFALELLQQTMQLTSRHQQRLSELAAGLAELETVNQMHDDPLSPI